MRQSKATKIVSPFKLCIWLLKVKITFLNLPLIFSCISLKTIKRLIGAETGKWQAAQIGLIFCIDHTFFFFDCKLRIFALLEMLWKEMMGLVRETSLVWFLRRRFSKAAKTAKYPFDWLHPRNEIGNPKLLFAKTRKTFHRYDVSYK